VFLDEYVDRMLGNCRQCRRIEDGRCSLDDRYEELLLDHMLPADGIVFAMPLYFYGMPGRLKTVFDRLFCYTANSAPQQDQVVDGIVGKRVGVLISCEESYVGATQGVIAQFQELTRYLLQDLVGVVVGNANSRGEIACDPTNPIQRALPRRPPLREPGDRLPTRHRPVHQGLGPDGRTPYGLLRGRLNA
jgi:multimeric flavodoxin WrbA